MDNQEFIETLLDDGLDNSTIIDFVETQNSEIVELREKLAEMEGQQAMGRVYAYEDDHIADLAEQFINEMETVGDHDWEYDDVKNAFLGGYKIANKPARITEQDAREIISAYIENKIGAPVNEWLAPLLKKLNADREQVPEVEVPDGFVIVNIEVLRAALSECFSDGYSSPSTYNDIDMNEVEDIDRLKSEAVDDAISTITAAAPSHSQQSAVVA